MSPHYVPVLKAREAEIKALLKAPTSLSVTPLFELQRSSAPAAAAGEAKRAKSSTTDASYFLDDIARLWGEDLYVDISRVAQQGNRETWWRLLQSLNALGAIPARLVPVLSMTDTSAVRAAAAHTAQATGRLAVRLSMPSVAASPGSVAGLCASVAADTGVPVTDIDVVLDWKDTLEQRPLDQLVAETQSVIAALGSQHGDLVTIGTPASEAFQQVGDWHPVRREWWLWLRLLQADVNITYGDYVLYPPSDPVPAAPRYGHLRYSSNDRLHVHRRPMPAGGGGLGGAFRTCCEHVVAQSYWLGAAFSGADRRIAEIAAGTDKESQAGPWRQIAAQHHFSLVAAQLTSPPSAPAPGTL